MRGFDSRWGQAYSGRGANAPLHRRSDLGNAGIASRFRVLRFAKDGAPRSSKRLAAELGHNCSPRTLPCPDALGGQRVFATTLGSPELLVEGVEGPSHPTLTSFAWAGIGMGIIEGGSSPLCFTPTLCSGRDDGQSLEMSNVNPWHQRNGMAQAFCPPAGKQIKPGISIGIY
jgi:hypothetical protein